MKTWIRLIAASPLLVSLACTAGDPQKGAGINSGMGMQGDGMQGGMNCMGMQGGMGMMDREHMMAMHEHMQKMRDMMAKIKTETDPKKRQQLMQEHMQAMQESMQMMHGNMNKGAMGKGSGMAKGEGMAKGSGMAKGDGMAKSMNNGKSTATCGADMMSRMQMMEEHMGMMQVMMSQMMAHAAESENAPQNKSKK